MLSFISHLSFEVQFLERQSAHTSKVETAFQLSFSMIIIVSLLLSNYSTSFESLEQVEAILLFFFNENFSFAAGLGNGQS